MMERNTLKKREYTIKKYKEGWSGYKISNQLCLPISTIYSWIEKYQNSNIEEMSNRITRIKMPIDDKTERYVIKLRNKWNWGPVRIEGFIRQSKPEGITPLGHNKIHQILFGNRLNMPLDFVRKTWGTKRFERRESSNSKSKK